MEETPRPGRTRTRRTFGSSGNRVPESVATRFPASSSVDLAAVPPRITAITTDSVSGISGKTPSNSVPKVAEAPQLNSNTTMEGEGSQHGVDAGHEDNWVFDSSEQHHHISTGGINPLPKRPAAKKSGKKRRRSIESIRLFKKPKKSAPLSAGSIGSASAHATSKVVMEDEAPLRLVNPLLELMEFPISATPLDISRVPNGAELHTYTELAFHRPDTYPLAYYARVLGFAVPDQPDGNEFVELDPNKVPLLSSVSADPFLQIPPEGVFRAPPQSKPCHALGDDDDRQVLDYLDPVYQYLLTNKNDDKVVPAVAPVPPVISNDCLAFARECGLVNDEWTFEYWKPQSISTAAPDPGLTKWLHERDLLEKLVSPATGHFLILALKNNIPEAWVSFQFQWCQLETELNIHKRPLSELILRIHAIHEREATQSDGVSLVHVANEDGSYDKLAAETANKGAPTCQESIQAVPQAGDNPNNSIVEAADKDGPTSDEGSQLLSQSLQNDGDNEIPGGKTGDKRDAEGLESKEAVQPDKAEKSAKYANPSVVLVLTALSLEHALVSNVWYALFDSPASNAGDLEVYFRMTRRPCRQALADMGRVSLVCDLKKYSFKYAFLVKKSGPPCSSATTGDETTETVHERLLVRMPTAEEVKTAMSASTCIRSHKRGLKRPANYFSNADDRQAQVDFGLRVRKQSSEIQITALQDGAEVELTKASSFNHMPSFEILRCFPVATPQKHATGVNEVLSELIEKQSELTGLEGSLEGKMRSLLSSIIQERREFESAAAVNQRSGEKRVLQENEKILQRRKEMALAWQKQLEQDMDAVCDICNDGEVSPDNQILFCEACNVAVHQICYGIEEVPVGDYYCVACRYFKREKMSDIISRMKRDPNAPKFSPSPLPICCELCPRKQGAFIRTDTSKQRPKGGELVALPKWVHVVCAKWQGLNFVDKSKADVVEDVTELKWTFRRLEIRCCLCLGERGAFNPCRFEGCKKNLHVTCARASGLCEVVHGENAKGPVTENPWTLVCPDHSQISADDIPKDAVTIDQLIRSAKEFPPEPKPEPPPRKPKPFSKLTAKERAEFLADPSYESDLFVDLLRRLQGMRCEVCDQYEEDGKRLKRCECGVVFCDSCSLLNIDGVDDSRDFTCVACKYKVAKTRKGEDFLPPRCYLCSQKGGWLRKAFAAPINKISYYKNNPKEFAKTLFAQQLWAHTLCVFWQYPKLSLNPETGKVDLSDVIMTHGRGFIFSSNRCGLCGGKGGLKVKCAHDGCRGWGEKQKPYQFHVTCAREAGLEVDCHEQEHEASIFYVKCYKHGGNAFNFRARLEDLIEIEKRRSGKRLERYSLPMSFFHGSRLLNGAIWVLKTLGWAWRWAEWWVADGSSWEPLLEEGQSEKNMTKAELRIVDSTPESRCQEARLCRLAAFGAALRNRAYDKENGFDNESLNRALRSVLHAKSLVGPLENYEIDFYVEWLARAYRSKSRLLGFGDDKIHIAAEYFCLHQENKSPKFELGGRPLPGVAALPKGAVFETLKDEVDDFLKPERLEDGSLFHTQEKFLSKKAPPFKKLAQAKNPKVLIPKNAKREFSEESDEGWLDANQTLSERSGRAVIGKLSARIMERKNQKPPTESFASQRKVENATRTTVAYQPVESEPVLEPNDDDMPIAASISGTTKDATPRMSLRPKKFRRSVLGGDVFVTRLSTPDQSIGPATRCGHKSADANFTPDEKTLPLSMLLSSEKRKVTRKKHSTDDSDVSGTKSIADDLAKAGDIANEMEASSVGEYLKIEAAGQLIEVSSAKKDATEATQENTYRSDSDSAVLVKSKTEGSSLVNVEGASLATQEPSQEKEVCASAVIPKSENEKFSVVDTPDDPTPKGQRQDEVCEVNAAQAGL